MHDRFEMRQVSKRNEKNKKDSAKEEGPSKKNEMKSSKFFSKLQEVAKDDATRKEQKRKARAEGINAAPTHTNQSSKRFKL
jgi:hypothetical protein